MAPWASEHQRKFFMACRSGNASGKLKCPPRKVIAKFMKDSGAKRRKRK